MVLAKKYKGNTLAEVLIAIVITSFCATLGVVIYINVQQNTIPIMKIKGAELTERYLKQAIIDKNYFDDEILNPEGYRVKRTVTRDEYFADCLEIKITTYNSENKIVSKAQTLVYE